MDEDDDDNDDNDDDDDDVDDSLTPYDGLTTALRRAEA